MDEMVALRCKYCGAPLNSDDLKEDSPYVTCHSCGTTQQRVDAKAYLDQLMGQVRSWVNKAIPGGMALAQSSNVDSVARYNIFMNDVKPRIDTEFGEFKFGIMSLLSHTMMVMPFTVDTTINPTHTSEKAFQFGETMTSIAPLAVTDDSSASVKEAKGVVDAYALLINNSKLLKEDKPGRYILMANNFTTAADDFGGISGYEPAKDRFTGLSQLCQGCEKMLNGDVAGSDGLFRKGRSSLETASKNVMTNMNVAIMGNAVNQEIKQADTLIDMADYINKAGASKQVMEAVRRIFTFSYPTGGNWGFMLSNRDRLKEIFTNMSACLSSKNGGGLLPIAAGTGDILVPFWHIDLKYSFQTGSLWKKHSVEVSETLMVPADFVIDAGCLSNARSAVTDVFGVKTSNGLFAGLSGSEKSISNGQGIEKIVKSVSQNSAGGRDVIVPLSTEKEAERIAEQYVSNVASVEDKLKLSNPDVIGLIYVPFTKNGNSLSEPDFGTLVPERIRRVNLNDLVIV